MKDWEPYNIEIRRYHNFIGYNQYRYSFCCLIGGEYVEHTTRYRLKKKALAVCKRWIETNNLKP